LERTALLEKEIEKANKDFETILGRELDGINSNLKGRKREPIKILTKEEYDKRQQ